MSPLRILSLARRIITQCLRDKRTFGLIIIVPSIVMALLGYFYTASTTQVVTIGVVNEDLGLGSVMLSHDVVDKLREQGNITVVELSRADVNQSLKDKKIDGAIIFGPGFTEDVLVDQTVYASIVTEGTDQGKSASVNMKAHNATIAALTSAMQGGAGFSMNLSLPAMPAGNLTNTSLRIGVLNQDEGLDGIILSDTLIYELLEQGNLTVVSLEGPDVNQSIKDKKLNAALVIGPDFTRDIYEEHAVNLSVMAMAPDPRNISAYQQGLSLLSSKLQNATVAALSNVKKNDFTVNVDSSVIYGDGFAMLDLFAPYLLGVIAFAFIFIFTGVTFLRERSFGTFERLLVSPITRSEIILGYMLGFSVFAIIQSMIILAFAVFVLNVKIVGNIYDVVALQLLVTLVSVNLGIFCSSFAKNELQAVQFIPLLILPQIFLDGMFWPISTLPNYLQVFSYLMPLTYANDALQNIMVRGLGLGDVLIDIVVLLAFAVVMVALSALSLNKRLQ
ncbi:ABC transporter permease protein [Methanocella paludicola SANAE]|uniref:ABC transporter permease protein n=1 Tax=Methanocella paludicola (strain DSM 17711 / JCM 13418 / NBRC 101707 / SANAE) TaxID=304371 RepID=D1YV55_METPS|nr:ABC transporter permease [Methanocella paludicola]BAI60327.1 ABC transporter permease protein [Methanocella paludicola SANAE]